MDAPRRHRCFKVETLKPLEAGVHGKWDLARNAFQSGRSDARGNVGFRKKLRRDHVRRGFSRFDRLVSVRLRRAPVPTAKSQSLVTHTRLDRVASCKALCSSGKNDAADAEATCEAAHALCDGQEPGKAGVRRCVPKPRDLLVHQRTPRSSASNREIWHATTPSSSQMFEFQARSAGGSAAQFMPSGQDPGRAKSKLLDAGARP